MKIKVSCFDKYEAQKLAALIYIKEGKETFDYLDKEGKKLALRLSFPYANKDKAVEDAESEMERRRSKENARNRRVRRLNKSYLSAIPAINLNY